MVVIYDPDRRFHWDCDICGASNKKQKEDDVGMPVTASMRKQERKKKNGGRPVVLR